mgnify:FL=1
MGIVSFIEGVVSTPDDSEEVRWAKAATFFTSCVAMLIVTGAALGTSVGTADASLTFGFSASANSVALLCLLLSVGVQLTLKALTVPLCLICFSTTGALLWTASSLNPISQGTSFIAVAGLFAPTLAIPLASVGRRYALRSLAGASAVYFLGCGAVWSIFFGGVNDVPLQMSAGALLPVLTIATLFLHACAAAAVLKYCQATTIVQRVSSSQHALETKLGLILNDMRTQLDGLIIAAQADGPPIHPAVAVAARVLEAAMDDAQSVMQYHVCYVNARLTDIRKAVVESVEAVESYIAESAMLRRHLDRRGRVRPATVRTMDPDDFGDADAEFHTQNADLKRTHGIFGDDVSSASAGGHLGGHLLEFDLTIDDVVPNHVVTDELRFVEAIKECTFNAARRARRKVAITARLEPIGPKLVVRFVDDGVSLSNDERRAVLKGRRATWLEQSDAIHSRGPRRRRPHGRDAIGRGAAHLAMPPMGMPRVATFLPLLGGSVEFDFSGDQLELSGRRVSAPRTGNCLVLKLKLAAPRKVPWGPDNDVVHEDDDGDADASGGAFTGDLTLSTQQERHRAEQWRRHSIPQNDRRGGGSTADWSNELEKHVPHSALERPMVSDEERQLAVGHDVGGLSVPSIGRAQPSQPQAASPHRRERDAALYHPLDAANFEVDATRSPLFWWPPRPAQRQLRLHNGDADTSSELCDAPSRSSRSSLSQAPSVNPRVDRSRSHRSASTPDASPHDAVESLASDSELDPDL